MGEAWDEYMKYMGGSFSDWQIKPNSFNFDVWIEKLELYVHERFEGREAGL